MIRKSTSEWRIFDFDVTANEVSGYVIDTEITLECVTNSSRYNCPWQLFVETLLLVKTQWCQKLTHDEIQFGFGVDDLIEFNDVWVFMFGETSQYSDFLAVLLQWFLVQFGLVHYLESN